MEICTHQMITNNIPSIIFTFYIAIMEAVNWYNRKSNGINDKCQLILILYLMSSNYTKLKITLHRSWVDEICNNQMLSLELITYILYSKFMA